jgi:DNA-binding response OmpR family regulator
MEKKKVLVIDDEQDVRDAVESTLSFEGITVIKANGGKEGIELAEKERPDLILLDIAMPEKNGIETLADIKATDWGIDTDVIMMTNLDDMAMMAEAIQNGSNEYVLKKDMSIRDLIAKVKSHLT